MSTIDFIEIPLGDKGESPNVFELFAREHLGLLFLSGSAIVLPWLIESRVSITASSITLFPAVRAVMSRPLRIGTPEEISVPSVRVKRATAGSG